MFIPLYPVGVASEAIIIICGLPYIHARDLHSISLPNSYNFAFSYWTFSVVGFPSCSATLDNVQGSYCLLHEQELAIYLPQYFQSPQPLVTWEGQQHSFCRWD